MDEEIAEQYLLDSILTLADINMHQLNDRQACRQVGFADQIFISKSDLVPERERDQGALMHRLTHMNPARRRNHFTFRRSGDYRCLTCVVVST
jgi:G3E family GTPase